MSNMFHLESSEGQNFEAGRLVAATKHNFNVLDGISMQAVHLEPGGLREPHLHPNAHQLDYVVSGRARVGIVGPSGASILSGAEFSRQLLELEPGDIVFSPQGYLHWIENAGEEPLHMILTLSHAQPETLELSEMVAGVPSETLAAMFNGRTDAFEGLPERAVFVTSTR